MPKLDIITNNIVILFSESISSTLKTDPIEEKIISIYADKTPNIIVNKSPSQVALFVPELQISIVASSTTLIITDQTVGDFSKKEHMKFSLLVRSVYEIVAKPLISYGFNFTHQLESDSFDVIKTKINQAFFVTAPVPPQGSSYDYALPTVYFKKDNAKIGIKFESISNAKAEVDNKINLKSNIHYNTDLHNTDLLEVGPLKEAYIEMESYIAAYVSNILT